MPNTTTPVSRLRQAFTLVEILVVIAIIGILMGIAIPAIQRALIKGRETAMRVEVTALSQAVEQYLQKYGDYPPDGSDLGVFTRHMRRVFPRMASPDVELLDLLLDNRTDDDPMSAGTFSGVAMDRAEAIVFFLGGFSDDVQHPLTGNGGPLSRASGTAGSVLISDYQYNATRDNSFFDFDLARLTVARATDTSPLLSTDETLVGNTAAAFGGADPLPAYRYREDEASPIVYFDSRTYGLVATAGGGTAYNGYLTGDFGGLRPYKTELNVALPANGTNYASEAEAFNAVAFHNANTFQIISPGMDGVYGSIVSVTASDPADTPIHFVTESGRPVRPAFGTGVAGLSDLIFTSTSLGSGGYQDVDWDADITVNGNLDNVTNFVELTLEGALP